MKMGNKIFTQTNKNSSHDRTTVMEENQDTRLVRTPTHRQMTKEGDQLTIGFEIFHFRGGYLTSTLLYASF